MFHTSHREHRHDTIHVGYHHVPNSPVSKGLAAVYGRASSSSLTCSCKHISSSFAPPPGEGDWCGWGDSFNAQKLKINGRSSSGNTLSQHGRLWDLHAIHLSNCIRASGDCCRIGTANFSRRPELFFRRKRRFSRRVGSVFAGGAAAIKTTSTATGLKKKKKDPDGRFHVFHTLFYVRRHPAVSVNKAAAHFSHSKEEKQKKTEQGVGH